MATELYTKFKKIDGENFSIEKKTITERVSTLNLTLRDLEKLKLSKQRAKQRTIDQSTSTVATIDAQIAEIDALIATAQSAGVVLGT